MADWVLSPRAYLAPPHHTQCDMLATQCIKNLWRKPAYRQLLNEPGLNAAAAPLNAWREPIQLRVDNSVPAACTFADKINVSQLAAGG